MTVRELTRHQLMELKEHYLVQLDDSGELEEVAGLDSLSYMALANADEIITDEMIFEHYDGIDFVEDDFIVSRYDNMED